MLDHSKLEEMETSLKARNIPIAELCRRANIEPTTWWRWKTGKFFPSFQAAKAVTDAYGGLMTDPPKQPERAA